ncbi:MAG: Uncharacterized protein Greene041619_847 [Candidatus Peregrinibacteria bacterium Greene0416_19]|nr:MAG: Uncharacterized protein Greene041619_847 [Candidatus Peregrinibacteria bacterium Greene0416_19]
MQLIATAAVAHGEPFRILLLNAGYCTELDGSLRDYFLRFYRYLHTPRRIVRRALRSLSGLLEGQKPDLCCFVEIHEQSQYLPHLQAYAYGDVENKYGIRSLLRRLPLFRHNCNGFLARKPMEFRKHYCRHGTKKLIYELELPHHVSLFLVHFALRARTRRKQCRDLAEILRQRRRVIVCGDFNTMQGDRELRDLLRSCRLRIANPPHAPTFPAVRPRKALDLFLCSPGLKIKGVRVMDSIHLSDHLPVLLELQL